MTFSRMATSGLRRLLAASSAGAVAVMLAACGGGTSQSEPFVAQRVFAFGDDNSALTSSGQKYGVNGLAADSTALNCSALPLWVQSVADLYGFVFAECNPNNVANPQAKMYAAAGAKVADVALQVEAQVAAGGFRDKDLATMLAGGNDIVELYAQYPARSEAELLAEARVRGAQLARVINRLVEQGSKVVVSNVPDMGLSPFAMSERALFADIDRAAFISRLTAAFNEQLGVTVLLDGRFIGLAQADLQFQAIARFPGGTVVSTAACAVAPPACTTATLLPNADPGAYLWADGTRLSYGGQNQIAQLAADRARRNPF
jgi:outer membrane lipase/esterase